MSQVKKHVNTLIKKKLFLCAVDDEPCDVCTDMRNVSDDAVVAKGEGSAVNYDTKYCSCYTYEICGDCSCVDDDVFCHA